MGMETDAKGYVSEKDQEKVFKTQLNALENRICFDCDAPNPSWISLSFGIYLCLNCSGRHRQMGTHVSFVRSIDMDKFTIEQLARMVSGGNKRAKAYFDSKAIPRNLQGYSSTAAALYKSFLDGDKPQNESFDVSKMENQAKKNASDNWLDQRIKSVPPAQTLGARHIDTSEFDRLFTQSATGVSSETNFSYPTNTAYANDFEFQTPPSHPYSNSASHWTNTYDGSCSNVPKTYMTNTFGDSSTFRTNTSICHRDNNDYWPSIEETAQHNIHELKEGIKNMISKGNKFYDKAKSWFNNI